MRLSAPCEAAAAPQQRRATCYQTACEQVTLRTLPALPTWAHCTHQVRAQLTPSSLAITVKPIYTAEAWHTRHTTAFSRAAHSASIRLACALPYHTLTLRSPVWSQYWLLPACVQSWTDHHHQSQRLLCRLCLQQHCLWHQHPTPTRPADRLRHQTERQIVQDLTLPAAAAAAVAAAAAAAMCIPAGFGPSQPPAWAENNC